jgi:hypothetical protein
MLVRSSPDVAECLQHAADCELQAARARDPDAKQSFLDLAARWRRIAETCEYIERVDQFLSKPKP